MVGMVRLKECRNRKSVNVHYRLRRINLRANHIDSINRKLDERFLDNCLQHLQATGIYEPKVLH
jgi:hypothetical protein